MTSITKRLALTFATVILVAALIGGAAMIGIQLMSFEIDQIVSQDLPEVEQADSLAYGAISLVQTADVYFAGQTRDPDVEAKIAESMATIRKDLTDHVPKEAKEQFETVTASLQQAIKAHTGMAGLVFIFNGRQYALSDFLNRVAADMAAFGADLDKAVRSGAFDGLTMAPETTTFASWRKTFDTPKEDLTELLNAYTEAEARLVGYVRNRIVAKPDLAIERLMTVKTRHWPRMQAAFEALRRHVEEVDHDLRSANQTARRQLSADLKSFAEIALTMTDDVNARVKRHLATVGQISFIVMVITGLVLLIGLTVSVVASIRATRTIGKPLRDLEGVTAAFAERRYDQFVPHKDRVDEIGMLAKAMQSFREALIRNKHLEEERLLHSQRLEVQVEERTQQLNQQKQLLADALAKEHELNSLQRQFVAMVCHEFRTPLAIIDGNAQRLLRRHDTITLDRLKGSLGTIRTSVGRLTDLMESVLSAARLEAGTIKFDPETCNIREMIQEVIVNYQELNPSYRIVAKVEQLPDRFFMDLKLMRQVISNLVSNAVKYSPEGTRIWIDGDSTDDGGIVIAVRDEGVGIPEDEVERLFQRFFRASTSTGIAGTGIGLHMIKALVDMHNGKVEVMSEVGVGTKITVYLPNQRHKAPTQLASSELSA